MASFYDMFIGIIPGSIGETSTLAVLIGAAILIFTGIGSWKIMLSVVLGTLTIGYLCNILALNDYMAIPAHYHLVMGGFAFGAVFMATDPVTASHTEKGKWIYGFMIGALAVMIRIFNPAYPEGMMLAILLMNVWSPLIDYFVVESHIKRRLKRAKLKANS
jgi:Na+-transporting NADH:ubiquinone oxidoreductase subunit B